MAENKATTPGSDINQQLPSPTSGITDSTVISNPSMSATVDLSPQPVFREYANNSVLDLMYGANDPSVMASQFIQSGEVFRLQRGTPYKRAGHMVPVFPQFKTQNVTLQNLASQPQANRSVAQILKPTADTSTTDTSVGTPFIGYPGFNKLNLT